MVNGKAHRGLSGCWSAGRHGLPTWKVF